MSADYYRRRAQECRLAAARSAPATAFYWGLSASYYDRLAEAAEKAEAGRELLQDSKVLVEESLERLTHESTVITILRRAK